MVSVEARIETGRASRYLVQLCRHAAAMSGGHGPRVHLRALLARRAVAIHTECSDTHGSLVFDPWGRCTIEATTTELVLRIDATDEENLHRIQDVVTRNLERFGRRDRLAVSWPSPPAPTPAPPTQAS